MAARRAQRGSWAPAAAIPALEGASPLDQPVMMMT
jgi:hypothetical protein